MFFKYVNRFIEIALYLEINFDNDKYFNVNENIFINRNFIKYDNFKKKINYYRRFQLNINRVIKNVKKIN